MLAPLLLSAALIAAPVPRSIALISNGTADVAPELLARVDRAVRDTLATRSEIRLQSQAETMVGVDQAKDAGWACMGGAACLAELGRALAVDQVLTVTLGRRGALLLVELQAVAVAQAAETGRATALLPEDPARWPAIVGRALRAVHGEGATLQVSCTDCGQAQLSLDDEDLGTGIEQARVGGLSAGPHVLRAVFPNQPPVEHQLDVTEAGSLRVEVDSTGIRVPGAAAVNTSNASGPPVAAPILWGVGGGAAALAALVFVGTLGAAVAGAAALVSLERDDRGRAVARENQPRSVVELQLYGGSVLAAAAVLGAALTALTALGAVAALAAGTGLFATADDGGAS